MKVKAIVAYGVLLSVKEMEALTGKSDPNYHISWLESHGLDQVHDETEFLVTDEEHSKILDGPLVMDAKTTQEIIGDRGTLIHKLVGAGIMVSPRMIVDTFWTNE